MCNEFLRCLTIKNVSPYIFLAYWVTLSCTSSIQFPFFFLVANLFYSLGLRSVAGPFHISFNSSKLPTFSTFFPFLLSLCRITLPTLILLSFIHLFFMVHSNAFFDNTVISSLSFNS